MHKELSQRLLLVCLASRVYMLRCLTRLGAEEERASHSRRGTAKGMPHRLGDFREGVLMSSVTNTLETFSWLLRKPGDLLLIILEVKVLTAPSNIASRAEGDVGWVHVFPCSWRIGRWFTLHTVSERVPHDFSSFIESPPGTLCLGQWVKLVAPESLWTVELTLHLMPGGKRW